jgi:hypothetical protein
MTVSAKIIQDFKVCPTGDNSGYESILREYKIEREIACFSYI